MPPRRATGQNRTGGAWWNVNERRSERNQEGENPPVHVVHHPERRPYPEPDPTDKVAWERWDHHRRFVMWLWGSGSWG